MLTQIQHLSREVRQELALLPESPSREELYVLWTHLLQRYFPFRLHSFLPNLADLPDETEVKYTLGTHQETDTSHIALTVGREYGPFDRLNFLHVFCQAEPKPMEGGSRLVEILHVFRQAERTDGASHLPEMEEKLKEEMTTDFHSLIARGRGMTIHGAIVIGREVSFYKLKRDGSFECMTWLVQEKKSLHIVHDMRTITTHLMQINYEVRMRD
jgi:hypothetical protein